MILVESAFGQQRTLEDAMIERARSLAMNVMLVGSLFPCWYGPGFRSRKGSYQTVGARSGCWQYVGLRAEESRMGCACACREAAARVRFSMHLKMP